MVTFIFWKIVLQLHSKCMEQILSITALFGFEIPSVRVCPARQLSLLLNETCTEFGGIAQLTLMSLDSVFKLKARQQL